VEDNDRKMLSFGYGNSIGSPLPTIETDIWSPSGIQYDGTVSVDERHLIGVYISNWSTHRSTGFSNLRYNGSDVTTKTYNSIDPLSLNNDPMKIGVVWELVADSFFGGDMQELIVYNTDQNSNRVGIEENINVEYAIY
jgi:hypothetical protein